MTFLVSEITYLKKHAFKSQKSLIYIVLKIGKFSVLDSYDVGTIAAKILWSSLFDTSNVNQVLTSIYMTISNYSCQKYGTFSF
jgi:hypothetical protein